MYGDVKDVQRLEVNPVRNIIRIVTLAVAIVLTLSVASAEQIVYSENQAGRTCHTGEISDHS